MSRKCLVRVTLELEISAVFWPHNKWPHQSGLTCNCEQSLLPPWTSSRPRSPGATDTRQWQQRQGWTDSPFDRYK